MRTGLVTGASLALALSLAAPARSDDTRDLAVCMNLTVITNRDSPSDERLAACNRLIQAHSGKPDSSDFYYRASVYAAMERPGDALADLDTALKLSAPGDVLRGEYYLSRARIMLANGLRTPDEALADATTAIEIISARGPDLDTHFADDIAQGYFWRGGAYAEKADKLHASADFKKAMSYDIDPQRREVMIKLMTALGYPPN